MLVHLLLLVLVHAEEDDIGTCPQTTVMGLCETLHRTRGLLKGDQDLSKRRTVLQERRIEDLEKRLNVQEENMQYLLDQAEDEEDQPVERPQPSAGGDEKTVTWNTVKSILLKVEELRTRTTELEKELLEEQEKRQQLLALVEETRNEGRSLREDVSSHRMQSRNAVNKTEILLLTDKTEHLEKRLKAEEANSNDRIATLEKEISKINDNFGCPKTVKFHFDKLKDKYSDHVTRRKKLREMACTDYNFVWRVKAQDKIEETNGFLNVTTQVLDVLKHGTEKPDDLFDQVRHFLLPRKCDTMVPGETYIIMGQDGKKNMDDQGNIWHRYTLDQTTSVHLWISVRHAQDKDLQRVMIWLVQALKDFGCS